MSQAYLLAGGKLKTREVKFREIYQQYKPRANFSLDPDLHLLSSETSLKIEEIRELGRLLSLKCYGQPPKVAGIKEAEKMTPEAQNALLKMLEEPPGETIFILTTNDETRLLSTIVSRCQLVYLPPEIQVSLTEEEMEETKKLTQRILESRAGERLKMAEDYTTREETVDFCQKQLVFWRNQLIIKPTPKNARILREIQKTLRFLTNNANVRLAIDNLFLAYPDVSNEK